VPIVLIWMVYKLRYDRRALWWQIPAGSLLLIITRLVTDPDDNINRVYGPYDPQTTVPSWIYMAGLLVFVPICFYVPVHFALIWIGWDRPKSARPKTEPAVGVAPTAVA
jgi:hypothetical protein